MKHYINVRDALIFPYSELFIGLIFGDFGITIPKDISTQFRVSGLTHLLVVSGSQISLLSGVILSGLRFFSMSRFVTFIVIIWVHCLFYLITGGGSSIFRSIVMFDIMLGLSLLKRRPSQLDVICITFIVMVMINP